MHKERNEDYYLWESFKKGHEDAFYKLYDQYADILFEFGMHFSKDKDYVQDCIHDLFLDLYKYRNKLSENNNIRFYLLRSFRRLLYKSKIGFNPSESTKITNLSAENQELAFEDFMIESETEAELFQKLNQAISKLSNRQREGLTLKFKHNLSYPEIAEMMGMSVESARTSIYRALKTLRSYLDSNEIIFLFSFFKST